MGHDDRLVVELVPTAPDLQLKYYHINDVRILYGISAPWITLYWDNCQYCNLINIKYVRRGDILPWKQL